MVSETVEKLHKRLVSWADDYYNGLSKVTDELYDATIEALRKLDPEHPAVQAVGAPPVGKVKVKHPIRVGSLSKAHSVDELVKYFGNEDITITITPKYDGLSLLLHYEDGWMTKAVTRGDGTEGEDVTSNARHIVPPYIGTTGHVLVRGEVLMRRSKYMLLKEQYSNPRNAASGILRRDDMENLDALSFHAFEMWDDMNGEFRPVFEGQSMMLRDMQERGFVTPHAVVHVLAETRCIQEYIDEYAERRKHLDYDTDGLVFRAVIDPKKAALDQSARPKYACAWKPESETAVTTVREVQWQTGRTGVCTPVAVFDPVDIAGASIQRASLASADEFHRLHMAPGDMIVVSRRNDVIPKVEEVLERSGDDVFEVPTNCPVCGHKLREFAEANIGCSFEYCPARVSGRIQHFAKVLKIKNLGPKMADVICDLWSEYIQDTGLVALFTADSADYENLPTDNGVFGQVGIGVHHDLTHLASIPFWKFIHALGIPHCGEVLAQEWGAKFEPDTFVQNAIAEDTGAYADERRSWLIAHKDEIAGLLRHIAITVHDYEGPLAGKTVSATGKLSIPRDVLFDHVRRAGGSTSNSVTAKVDILVMADPDSTSSKAQKARKLGVEIIDEQELMRRVEVGIE